MWKDNNDAINEIYLEFGKKMKVPAKCPISGKESAHLYMSIHNWETKRGGLWVWCSECHTFSHSSIYVPDVWTNLSEVDIDKLCAIPTYLEELKEYIDEHVIRREGTNSI